MRVCVIDAGSSLPRAVVECVSVSDGWTDPLGRVVVQSDVAEIGWSYDGAALIDPSPAPPKASVSDLINAASLRQDLVLNQIWSFNVGTDNAPTIATTFLNDKGSASMTKLVLWALLNQSTAGALEPYNNVDGTPLSLTPTQALALGTKAGAVISATYGTLNDLSAGILAASPTITTIDQIASAKWPAPSTI